MFRENVPLATLTTLRVGGPARFVYAITSVEGIKTALAHARQSGLSLYPLGQGSNMLAHDSTIEKVILKMENDEISIAPGNDTIVEVIAGAGYAWDTLVQLTVTKDLWGIENLAAIPGTVGAAPVQNIGAYGAEFADTFAWLECYDMETDTVMRLDASQCAFGYRDSRFKKEPNLIILRVALHLARTGVPKVSYPDIAKRVDAGEALDTPAKIADAIRSIRSVKFPDLTKEGTAGSFFKNPTISIEEYAVLKKEFSELPGFKTVDGIKVSLAWILDHVLHLRDFHLGNAHLFANQPLVLVTDANATAADVHALAQFVTEAVFNATGIKIEREVRTLE